MKIVEAKYEYRDGQWLFTYRLILFGCRWFVREAACCSHEVARKLFERRQTLNGMARSFNALYDHKGNSFIK